MNQINTTNRIIAFDVLRALMVILLILFHCGVSFMVSDVSPEIWTYKNQSTSIVFDALLGFIHTFRHPTFFIISGFVSEMMYQKYKPNIVLKKRFERIFIPFVITVLLFSSLVHFLLNQLEHINLTFSFVLDTSFVWFLYYLSIYSVLHFIYKKYFSKSTTHQFQHQYLAVILILVYGLSSLVLFLWGENSFFGEYGFLPELGSIFGYSLFYILGIYFYLHQNIFFKLKNYGLLITLIGFTGLIVYFLISSIKISNQIAVYNFDWFLMLSYNLSAVFISLGSIGLALKYYKTPMPLITYLSKSSYFLYLIHFPFVLIFLLLISDSNWNVFIKFSVVFSLTLLISFLLNWLWRKIWKGNPPI